jgi:penicillin-binding protein 1A
MSFKKICSRWLLIAASTLITFAILVGLAYLYMEAFLPDVTALRDAALQVPLKIYTEDGNLLAEFGQMQREPLPYEKIPPLLIDAVVATEDQRYFEHHGIDLPGLARAAWELAVTGVRAQGGSTVTMQVARNFYLSREKTFGRKFNEILLALKIDRELPKEKIMELYLNKIYLGKRAYGVEAAARVYFGKPLSQLALPDLALIAGLPKAPSSINPIADPIAAKARRNHVLERMYVLGYIDEHTYKQALVAPILVNYHAPDVTTNAPYVAEMVRSLMEASYGSDAYTQGYKVYTTVLSKLQNDANTAVVEGLEAYDARHGFRPAEQNLGSFSESVQQSWEDSLSGIDTIDGLVPVAVIQVSSQTLTVLDSNGQKIELNWPALAWTKKNNAHEIAKVGDVLRIKRVANVWLLAQLPKVEAALISLDPNDGAIRALVGGFSFFESNFNRVTQASRQPGSSFKPFIYAAAFNKGYTLASVFDDNPISIANPWSNDVWEPANDENEYWGPVRLRFALAHSLNAVSIRLLQAIGLDYTLDYLRNFGFNRDKLPHNLTLALGTPELTPLEMASAYAVFANGGYRIAPHIIARVEDRKGNVIYQAHPKVVCAHCTLSGEAAQAPDSDAPVADAALLANKPAPEEKAVPDIAPQAISPQTAFLVTQAMQEVVRSGTGAAVRALDRHDLAGKTGTTNDYVDAWFSGFNSDLETTVWVGFDKPQPLKEYGARVALPIWIQYMGAALAGKPEHTMAIPEGIVSAKIDPRTGAAVTVGGIDEYFAQDAMPSTAATVAPASSTEKTEAVNQDS